MLKVAYIAVLAISANCLLISAAPGLHDQSGLAESHNDERRNGREGPQESTSVSKPEDLVAPSEPSAYVRVDEYLTGKARSHKLKENIKAARKLLGSLSGKERSQEYKIAKHLSELAEEKICAPQNLVNAVVGLRYITGINKDMFGEVNKERRLSRLWSDYVNKLRTKCEPKFERKWKKLDESAKFTLNHDTRFESVDLYAAQYEDKRQDHGSSSTHFKDSLNLLMRNGDGDSDIKFDSNQPLLSLDTRKLLEKKLINPCESLFINHDARKILTKATLLGYLLHMTQSHGLKSPQLHSSDFTGGEGPKIYKWAARYMKCKQLLTQMIQNVSDTDYVKYIVSILYNK